MKTPRSFMLWLDEAESGPFTLTQVRSLWMAGRVTSATHAKSAGDSDWSFTLGDMVAELEAPEPLSGTVTADVRSFSMSFGDMVVFMVKWVIASIPALIILVAIGTAVVFVMGGAVIGFMSALFR